jgi:hypothetical protein
MKFLNSLSPSARRGRFIGLLFLTIAIFLCFRFLDAPLRTAAAPSGIVSFELAGTVANAQAMIDSWDARAQLFAAFGLGLDYLFMPAYGLTFALACLLVARKHPGTLSRAGRILAWGLLPAVVCDAIENLGLWLSLSGGVRAPWPQISAVCATIKFALLGLALVYALVGWLWRGKKENQK